MARVSINKDLLDELADSIGAKFGESTPMTIAEMQDTIDDIPTQGAATITPTESQQTAVQAGRYTTGAVTVDAIPSNYVGSGVTRRSSSDLTVSGATVTAPAGYYGSAASKSVAAGTAGTPTATKGAVSNHSVSVTPSVTNTEGYIGGGTTIGTAVTVSASELVSGTIPISANGTVDVTNYASANVNVQSSGVDIPIFTVTGETTATCNKTYDEAEDIYNSTTGTALVYSNGYHATASVYDYGYGLTYVVYDEEGLPLFDIYYASNGTITLQASAIPSGEGSSYTPIYSTTVEVATTSTTAVTVATIETGDSSIWTSNKMVYVKIRDTAGWRSEHFYGMDAFLANNIPAIGLTSTQASSWFARGYSMNTLYKVATPDLTYNSSSSIATGYGVYPDILYNDGSIRIRACYSSNGNYKTQTIDGTFSVEVYLVDWPGGVNPFNE